MTRHVNYQCPRCGYSTNRKSCMYKHLFANKKMCPSAIEDIFLSDEIKHHIVEHRVYHAPKNEAPTHQTTNIIQNNFISNLNVIDKLEKFLRHHNITLIGFQDCIENKFDEKTTEIESLDKLHNDFQFDNNNLLEIVDNATLNDDQENLNILYDKDLKKMKVYDEGQWEELLLTSGTKKLLLCIQDNFLNECYLIRCIKSTNESNHGKAKSLELLKVLYQFLAAFDVTPYVYQHSDGFILYSPDDFHSNKEHTYELEEEFYKLYSNLKNTSPQSMFNTCKKEVYNIIKSNSKRSIDDLNKKVAQLIHMDPSFQKSIKL